MPPQIKRRRTDGFSDDGLSYSVASDFDKQIGQALANQEARLKDPRYIPGAQVERPDSPDILRQELIDPVLTAFGMDRDSHGGRYGRGHDSASRYSMTKGPNGEVIAFDKVSGKASPVFQPDPKSAAVQAGIDLVPKNKSQTDNWFATSPLMQQEESEALASLSEPGADAVDILGVKHPTLLQHAPYATRFGPTYRSAMEKRGRLENAPVEAITPNVGNLIGERDRLMKSLTPDLPPETAAAVSNRVAAIDSAVQPQQPVEGGEQLVSVFNPKGKPTRIKRADLDRAIKLGYRAR